jgi:hypothetical protein
VTLFRTSEWFDLGVTVYEKLYITQVNIDFEDVVTMVERESRYRGRGPKNKAKRLETLH